MKALAFSWLFPVAPTIFPPVGKPGTTVFRPPPHLDIWMYGTGWILAITILFDQDC
jgi:hypothetical protein